MVHLLLFRLLAVVVFVAFFASFYALCGYHISAPHINDHQMSLWYSIEIIIRTRLHGKWWCGTDSLLLFLSLTLRYFCWIPDKHDIFTQRIIFRRRNTIYNYFISSWSAFFITIQSNKCLYIISSAAPGSNHHWRCAAHYNKAHDTKQPKYYIEN